MTDYVLEVSSSLTDRYQTTVPEAVRQSLQLQRRDRIRYRILPDGDVLIQRAAPVEDDPVIAQYVAFLATDMARHPSNMSLADAQLVGSIQALVNGVEIDFDAPLPDDYTDE